MATTVNRVAAKARLVTVLAADADLTGVQVSHGWPVTVDSEHVIVGTARGELGFADIRAGRKSRTDDFTVDVWVMAGKSSQTAVVAETRAELLAKQVDDIIAADPTLGGAVDGLMWASVTTFEGPDSEAIPEGYAGICRLVVAFKFRLL